MQRQYNQKALLLSVAAFFVTGLVVGALLMRMFSSPSSAPAVVDISAQLKEAHALLDQNRLGEAEKAYLAIIARDPGNPEALSHLGNVAFQQGDIERALRFYDMSLQQDSAYAHALWDKGIALRAKGDLAGAITAWEAFTRLFPDDSADVVQVKKWIAEAQSQLASAPPSRETSTKRVFQPPPEGFLRGKSSK